MFELSYTGEGKLIAIPSNNPYCVFRQLDKAMIPNLLAVINMPTSKRMMIASMVRASRSAADFRSWSKTGTGRSRPQRPNWILENLKLVRTTILVQNKSSNRKRWAYVYRLVTEDQPRNLILGSPGDRWDFIYCPKTRREPAVVLYHPHGQLTMRYVQGNPPIAFDEYGMYANNQT